MFEKARSGRDVFGFSLRGMKTTASFAVVPVVADDHINKIIDERLRRPQKDQPDTVRRIEDFFAGYFAPLGQRVS